MLADGVVGVGPHDQRVVGLVPAGPDRRGPEVPALGGDRVHERGEPLQGLGVLEGEVAPVALLLGDAPGAEAGLELLELDEVGAEGGEGRARSGC